MSISADRPSPEPPPVVGRWLDADQQRSWRALLLGTTLLMDRLDADLRAHCDLSMAEYEVLVRLSESEGRMRMARLAASLAHSRSRVTHTVARMERAGLVERVSADDDGRGIVAVLTAAGLDLLERIAPVHVNGVRDNLVDLVDPDDFAAVGRVLNAVADHLIGEHPERELR